MGTDSGVEPKVSVLLTTYNHERFIEDAFESVLRQQVDFPVEIIVADDGSDDETRLIVLDYALEHPDRVRLLLPAQNIGMNPIFRQALDAARGEYLAFLDGDDYWTSPDKLRTQVELLDEHPDWVSCFHDAIVFYEDESAPPRRFTPGFDRRLFGREDAIRVCFAPTLSVLLRRSALEAVPDWVFEYTWSDWLIHIFTAERGRIGFVDRVMGAYRVHRGGIFSSQDRSSQLEEDLRVYERLTEELPDQASLIERCVVHRRCQLAVEELGAPHASPVVVIDEHDDMPLYFNGRHGRYLPGTESGAGAGLDAAQRLDLLLAELTALPSGPPHYRPRTPVGEERIALIVVPHTAGDYLARHPELGERLQGSGRELHRDRFCAIWSLALPSSTPRPPEQGNRGFMVDEVRVADPLPKQLRAGRIEAPATGTLASGAATIVGWVIGSEDAVDSVEVTLGDRRLFTAPVAIPRPDLAESFGDGSPPRAGFSAPLTLDDEATLPAIVEANAVLANGMTTRFGTLRLERFEVPRPPGPRWTEPDASG